MHVATAVPTDRSCATASEASAFRARATGKDMDDGAPVTNDVVTGSGWSTRTLRGVEE